VPCTADLTDLGRLWSMDTSGWPDCRCKPATAQLAASARCPPGPDRPCGKRRLRRLPLHSGADPET